MQQSSKGRVPLPTTRIVTICGSPRNLADFGHQPTWHLANFPSHVNHRKFRQALTINTVHMGYLFSSLGNEKQDNPCPLLEQFIIAHLRGIFFLFQFLLIFSTIERDICLCFFKVAILYHMYPVFLNTRITQQVLKFNLFSV